MSISQEQPPVIEDVQLREYLSRRFIEVGNELQQLRDALRAKEEVLAEWAVLRGSLTFSGNTLTNYPTAWKYPTDPSRRFPPDISYDAGAGTITIGKDGGYSLRGYVRQSDGSNNAQYSMLINVTGVGQFVIGSGVWTNQTGGLVYSAEAITQLPAGAVVTLEYLGPNAPTVSHSNLEIKMLTEDDSI